MNESDNEGQAPSLRDIRRILVENLSDCGPTLVRPGIASDLHHNVGYYTQQQADRKGTSDE